MIYSNIKLKSHRKDIYIIDKKYQYFKFLSLQGYEENFFSKPKPLNKYVLGN